MANIKFKKVTSLPYSSCTQGDVYFVAGSESGENGLYVCLTTGTSSTSGTFAQFSEMDNATASVAGLMSAADKTKLNGIETGANKYVLPVAGTALGGVKSGTDITVDSSGNVSVNDNSHAHTIANITDLQSALDGKAASSHNHSTKDVTTLTNYSKGSSSAALATTDTLNAALGKLENKADNAQTTANSKWTKATANKSTEGVVSYSGSVTDVSTYTESPIISGHVYYKDTNTHNSHKVTFTNGTATDSTGTSVAVVTTANSSTSASSGDIAATTTRVNVPTLVVTSGLATRISNLETTVSTSIKFKGTVGTDGTVTDLPTEGVAVGDAYIVKTAGTYAGQICEVGDMIIATATTPTWTVVQNNLNVATADSLGTIKIGYSTSNKNYAVALDTNNKAYVNVPWTDTHYTTYLKVGASATATANAAASNGSVYMNVIDNTTVRDSHNIVGSGATTVKSDAEGKITITSTDTKNTAGASNTSSKIYLVGATSQTDGIQTYSHDTAYVGTDGCLYSGGSKVLTSHQDAVTSLMGKTGAITMTTGSTTAKAVNFAIDSNKNISGTVYGVATSNDLTTHAAVVASSSALGHIKIGFTTSASDRNYAVVLNSSNQAYVNVPWSNTTYSAGSGLSLSGTTFNAVWDTFA